MTPQEINLEILIGKRLKQARRESKLTQKQLGEPFDLSFQQIQKYESGKNRVSASRLLQFAIFLNEPIEFFLCDAKAHLTNKPLLVSAKSSNGNIEEATIYRYGLVVHEIEDDIFRDALLRLARRHNKIAGLTASEET